MVFFWAAAVAMHCRHHDERQSELERQALTNDNGSFKIPTQS